MQFIGDDLAERRGNALTNGVATGVQQDFAATVDLDSSILPRSNAAGFDEAAYTDSDGSAFLLGGSAGLLEFIVSETIQCQVELGDKISGIVDHVVKRMLAQVVGHLFTTN